MSDIIQHLQDIPRLEIPLHTLIELTPKPDGKMAEERIHLDVLKFTTHKAGLCCCWWHQLTADAGRVAGAESSCQAFMSLSDAAVHLEGHAACQAVLLNLVQS